MFQINHDLHTHSGLSICSSDPTFSAQHLLDHALESGYDMIALTNHMWDPMVPSITSWYETQTIEHIKQALPLPQASGIRFLFGCETDYAGGNKLGLHPDNYDNFEIIIVPVNHFNITGYTQYEGFSKQACWFTNQVDKLESLLECNLPWDRVGLAHLQWYEVQDHEIEKMLALESRYEAVFREYARRGVGIELNAAVFIYTDPEEREAYENLVPAKKESQCASYDKMLWLFSLAKKAGCKFYLGSDSHTHLRLKWPQKYLRRICDDLGLEEVDRFIPAAVK